MEINKKIREFLGDYVTDMRGDFEGVIREEYPDATDKEVSELYYDMLSEFEVILDSE